MKQGELPEISRPKHHTSYHTNHTSSLQATSGGRPEGLLNSKNSSVTPYLSDGLGQNGRMNYRAASEERVEIVAGFGAGALVRTVGGRYRFQGGTSDDRSEAKKWIALFAPDIALDDE